MEVDTATRYRSRILREMNANRDNPFNSPPSSTGSHGTVSPTMSSVFSDPDGESTRRLNEDIARVTAPRKLPINWEAAHRKWPEYYSMPKKGKYYEDDDNTDIRPLTANPKENRISSHPSFPNIAKLIDDTTEDAWNGSKRTRAEMQPRVDNESDLSSILSKSPARALAAYGIAKPAHQPSPLAKLHTREQSEPTPEKQRRPSISEALERLRRASSSPRASERQHGHSSPHMSSAKSSLTAVPPSPPSVTTPERDGRSFFMPDVSHLGDFVTGTLKFSGSMENGVPILVKHGKVHDQKVKPFARHHAEVDAIQVPEEEEKIFVSMDMIREEIVSLQEHHDKIQEYAAKLQHEVERLEGQLQRSKSVDDDFLLNRANDQVMAQKKQLEDEVASLQKRLDQATRKISTSEIENDTLAQERDRVMNRLQEACEDINKLTRKLGVKEKELETTNKQLDSTDHVRQDNDTLRRDLASLKQSREALEEENASLRSDNEALRRELKQLRDETESLRTDSHSLRQDHQSLISENRSLRNNNKSILDENEELRENVDGLQHELDAAREEVETLQQELQNVGQEKSTLREDNDSLVRHNEKYFSENKILRRENSGFERSVHDLHDKNIKLKEEVEFLKQQLDHCRPIPKEDFSVRVDDEETEENMTSAFFVPDITMDTNQTDPVEATETKDLAVLPGITGQTDNVTAGTEGKDLQGTRNLTKQDNTEKTETRSKNKIKTKVVTIKGPGAGQKVAFSIPEKSSLGGKHTSNQANHGSKRRSVSRTSFPDFDQFDDDTTGFLSVDNTTQDQAISLNLNLKSNNDNTTKETKTIPTRDAKAKPTEASKATITKNPTVLTDVELGVIKPVDKDSCPTLSNNARRILDSLAGHSCQNCIVCTRITSHRGVVSSAELAVGKKRVTVPRPVPVTDRQVVGDDPTVRPAQSPGQALALVIKGLEDESKHLQLELTRIQAQYNGSDKSFGRKERLVMAESIRVLLKRLEVKNDQIYSLYDVLEGQKAAGQMMTEEEVELTVINITGMTIRDVTSQSDHFAWDATVER